MLEANPGDSNWLQKHVGSTQLVPVAVEHGLVQQVALRISDSSPDWRRWHFWAVESPYSLLYSLLCNEARQQGEANPHRSLDMGGCVDLRRSALLGYTLNRSRDGSGSRLR